MNALKEEVVTLNEKLHELTEEELAQVTGGGTVLPGASALESTVSETTVIEPPSNPTRATLFE